MYTLLQKGINQILLFGLLCVFLFWKKSISHFVLAATKLIKDSIQFWFVCLRWRHNALGPIYTPALTCICVVLQREGSWVNVARSVLPWANYALFVSSVLYVRASTDLVGWKLCNCIFGNSIWFKGTQSNILSKYIWTVNNKIFSCRFYWACVLKPRSEGAVC